MKLRHTGYRIGLSVIGDYDLTFVGYSKEWSLPYKILDPWKKNSFTPTNASSTPIFLLNALLQIRLITFGQPRIGDYTYALNHNRFVPYSYRVVHRADIIPHVPPCKKLNGTCQQLDGA